MKLQRLTIHNIASIQDATIDFEGKPLCDSEVFLITGKTGAGKTTILDAICLALYAKTPRLEHTAMNGKVEEIMHGGGDKSQVLAVDDVRHLLRRNTGEGWSKLVFEGTNGVRYEATWSVSRAHKKPTGTLQAKRWELLNLETGMTLNKDKEIEAEIGVAIGLDFDQFCRTVMLAQGEFTKFLNSTDKEKAVILEKITGVDVYSKIGIKIFDKARDCENEYNRQKEMADMVRVMSEEEMAAKLEEQKGVQDELKQLNALQARDDRDKKWLDDEQILRKQWNQSEQRYVEAADKVNNDAFKERELLVKEWRQTVEVRGWLAEYGKYSEQEAALDQRLNGLEQEYKMCVGGELWRSELLNVKRQQLMQTEQFLKEEAPRKGIYEHEQTIVAQLDIVVKNRQQMIKERTTMNALEQTLEPLQVAVNKMEEAVTESTKLCMDKEEALQKEEAELKGMNLAQLRETRESLVKKRGNLEQAKLAVGYWQSARTKLNKALEAVAILQKELIDKKKLKGNKEQEVESATKAFEVCKEQMESLRLSVDGLATTMREGLKEGDVCPVCGQRVVERLIPVEAQLQQAYQLALGNYQASETKLKTLERELNALNASIEGANNGLTQQLEGKVMCEEEAKQCEMQALEKVKMCGMEQMNETDELDLRLKEIDAELEHIKNELGRGEVKEKRVDEMRVEVSGLTKRKEELIVQRSNAIDKKNNCENQVAVLKKQLESLGRGETEAMERVAELIVVTGWEYDWRKDTIEFLAELRRMGAQYRKAEEMDLNLTHEVKMLNQEIEVGLNAQKEVKSRCEHWNEDDVAKSEVVELNHRWSALQASVVACQQERTMAMREKQKRADRLNEFREKHPNMGRKRLETLGAMTQQIVEQEEELLKREHEMVTRCLGEKENCKSQYDKHLESKPEMEENDNLATIVQRMNDRLEAISALQKREGAIVQMLEMDQKNRGEQAERLNKMAELRTRWGQWNRLKEMFGSADGSKFRTIAQSYVLANLLHSANHYMKTLSNRYRLKGQPGTFVIMLEDAYQGYVTRAASTLSGGESFLVSLSLALALADIGQRLSVDTLFIDEGFGTLSGAPLRNAIETLRQLHITGGRRVGIISHVEELKERIPVQIQVNQVGTNSYSEIKVVGETNG